MSMKREAFGFLRYIEGGGLRGLDHTFHHFRIDKGDYIMNTTGKTIAMALVLVLCMSVVVPASALPYRDFGVNTDDGNVPTFVQYCGEVRGGTQSPSAYVTDNGQYSVSFR